MANPEHLARLAEGVESWNAWRRENLSVEPDLSAADLRGKNLFEAYLGRSDLHDADLRQANLTSANLGKAILTGANLSSAGLSKAVLTTADLSHAKVVESSLQDAQINSTVLVGADLSRCDMRRARITRSNLTGAVLCEANLSETNLELTRFDGADLTGAKLIGARLNRASLKGAKLAGADLTRAILVETDLQQADLSGCLVYGVSAWGITLAGASQTGLIITRPDEPAVTVDDLEVAQFIYLLLNREKLRNVLSTITSKAVLVLGRFSPERKAVLDAIADELRKCNLLPIIFDFERATSRDFTETIKILAGLSLFVIVDITNPKSAPLELQATVPDYQIPFVPIIQEGEEPFAMFRDLVGKFDWMLGPVIAYPSFQVLVQNFKAGILDRAFKKHLELQKRKNLQIEVLSIEELVKSKAP
jgi:uncharacterized protein YjbI with pentapeptide repeats